MAGFISTIINDVKAAINKIGSFLSGFETGLANDLKFVFGNIGENNLTTIINKFINSRMKALGAASPETLMVIGFVGSMAEVIQSEGQDEAADQDAVQKFANAPEVVEKIAKISTSMAQKVVASAGEGGSPAGGWKLWLMIIAIIHAIEMAGMVGISGIRTFVSDPAFLGQRWNAATRAVGLGFLAFYKPPIFKAIGVFTAGDTQSLFNYYDNLKPTFIQNDRQKVQTIWNAQDFMDELDYLYQNQLAKGLETSKKVLSALIGSRITTTKTAPTQAAVGGGPTVSAPTTPTKVYAGIIAQGVLQPAVSFTPQPKDIIESLADLTSVMHDNLAGYISALPGKLHYTLEIVPRVILPDGTVAIASTVQVIKKYSKAGKPEYKTVVNRYAKLTIYMVTNDGQRRKLDEIVLGATDAINFQPSAQDLQNLATTVKTNVVTSNPTEIVSVAPAAPAITGLAAQLAKYNIFLGYYGKDAPGRVVLWERGYTAGNYNTNTAHEILDPQNLTGLGIDLNKLPSIDDLPRIPTGNVTQNALYGVASGANIHATDIIGIINNSYVPVDPDLKKPAGSSGFPRTITVSASALNVRQSPDSKSPLAGSQVLHQGDTFQAVSVVTGESVNGENRWWQSNLGHFVWVGGTTEQP